MRAAAALVRDGGRRRGDRASSRACGSRCSRSGRGRRCRRCRRSRSCCRRARRSSIYSFGCWARQTIVALSIVLARCGPTTPSPFAIDELADAAPAPTDVRQPSVRSSCSTARLHRYERRPIGALRAARAPQPPSAGSSSGRRRDGSWGGIQPPWVWSIVGAARARLLRSTIRCSSARSPGLDSFTVEDERRPPDRGVPVARSGTRRSRVIALLDAGLDAGPRGGRARGALARRPRGAACAATGRCGARTRRRAASRSSSRTTTTPTSTTRPSSCCALRRAPDAGCRRGERGLAWSLGMQSRGGGWGAFDVDNTSSLPAKLPFCDFGAVTDPPSADVTAHMVEMLAYEGRRDRDAATRRGIDYLLREQERGRLVVRALGREPRLRHRRRRSRAAPRAGSPTTRACAARSRGSSACRTPTAGSARTCRSYRDPDWRGRGASTASQTAWALLAFHAAGETRPGGRARGRLARRDPAQRRRLGRAVLHGHRLPGRLLPQLPPLPAGVPGDGARPDSGSSG